MKTIHCKNSIAIKLIVAVAFVATAAARSAQEWTLTAWQQVTQDGHAVVRASGVGGATLQALPSDHHLEFGLMLKTGTVRIALLAVDGANGYELELRRGSSQTLEARLNRVENGTASPKTPFVPVAVLAPGDEWQNIDIAFPAEELSAPSGAGGYWVRRFTVSVDGEVTPLWEDPTPFEGEGFVLSSHSSIDAWLDLEHDSLDQRAADAACAAPEPMLMSEDGLTAFFPRGRRPAPHAYTRRLRSLGQDLFAEYWSPPAGRFRRLDQSPAGRSEHGRFELDRLRLLRWVYTEPLRPGFLVDRELPCSDRVGVRFVRDGHPDAAPVVLPETIESTDDLLLGRVVPQVQSIQPYRVQFPGAQVPSTVVHDPAAASEPASTFLIVGQHLAPAKHVVRGVAKARVYLVQQPVSSDPERVAKGLAPTVLVADFPVRAGLSDPDSGGKLDPEERQQMEVNLDAFPGVMAGQIEVYVERISEDPDSSIHGAPGLLSNRGWVDASPPWESERFYVVHSEAFDTTGDDGDDSFTRGMPEQRWSFFAAKEGALAAAITLPQDHEGDRDWLWWDNDCAGPGDYRARVPIWSQRVLEAREDLGLAGLSFRITGLEADDETWPVVLASVLKVAGLGTTGLSKLFSDATVVGVLGAAGAGAGAIAAAFEALGPGKDDWFGECAFVLDPQRLKGKGGAYTTDLMQLVRRADWPGEQIEEPAFVSVTHRLVDAPRIRRLRVALVAMRALPGNGNGGNLFAEVRTSWLHGDGGLRNEDPAKKPGFTSQPVLLQPGDEHVFGDPQTRSGTTLLEQQFTPDDPDGFLPFLYLECLVHDESSSDKEYSRIGRTLWLPHEFRQEGPAVVDTEQVIHVEHVEGAPSAEVVFRITFERVARGSS